MVFSVSILAERYFWALPDDTMQHMILTIIKGLDIVQNLSIILRDNLNGCKLNRITNNEILFSFIFLVPLKDVFRNFSFITNKLMRDYGVSPGIIELLKQGRLFKDPIVSLISFKF